MSRLCSGPIDSEGMVSAMSRSDHGATVSFLGTVRNHHRGSEVVRLEYSSYPMMADRILAGILAEAANRWPVAVEARHRLGSLVPGDAAVVVVATSVHRAEAFAAAGWVMEEIKRRVPIWKKEFFSDGTVTWVGS